MRAVVFQTAVVVQSALTDVDVKKLRAQAYASMPAHILQMGASQLITRSARHSLKRVTS